MTDADRREILEKTRVWVRFIELPTSPELRSIFPQLPRWAEVAVHDDPVIAAAPPVHPTESLKASYGSTTLEVVAGATCQLTLDFLSPEGTVRRSYELGYNKARSGSDPVIESWSLARVTPQSPRTRLNLIPDTRDIAVGEFYGLAGASGGPLKLHRLGRGDNVTLLFAAIHGDEPNTAPLLAKLLQHLQQNPQDRQGCTVVICPIVSPEAWLAQSRCNGQGIDANRNFPFNFAPDDQVGSPYYRGQKALQTPESLTLQHLVWAYRPDKIVAVHCPFDLINYDGPAAALAEAMHHRSGQGIAPSIGYPTPGSFGTYAGLFLGIPTITLELPDVPEGQVPEDQWPRQKEALLEAIRHREP